MTFLPFEKRQLSVIAVVMLVAIGVPGTTIFPSVSAETANNFTVISGDDIKTNPLAQTMLERIEIMKQRIAEMQNKQKQISEHQKFIDEQRKIAKQKLNAEISRMNKDYADHTPKAAFASFVSKTPEKIHDVYWGMFDYQRAKVKAAQAAMKKILDDGGSYSEAREAYNKIAASKRIDLIEVTKNLNVQHGLADSKVQVTFDKYGKLPRTD